MKLYAILPEISQRGVWLPLRVSLRFFCSLEIKGAEHLREVQGPIIFASNHLSELDPLLIVSCLPFFSGKFPIIYVSREKTHYSGSLWKRLLYGGTFFKIIGAYPTYKGLKDYSQALRHHLRILQDGENIGIFPYGGIQKEHKPLKARGGVSFLTHTTKRPILPVCITGTESLNARNFFSRKLKITVTFGKPFHEKDIFRDIKHITLDDSRNDYEEAAAAVMTRIEKLAKD